MKPPLLVYRCSLCHRLAFKDPFDLFPSENCSHRFASNYLRLDTYGSRK